MQGSIAKICSGNFIAINEEKKYFENFKNHFMAVHEEKCLSMKLNDFSEFSTGVTELGWGLKKPVY